MGGTLWACGYLRGAARLWFECESTSPQVALAEAKAHFGEFAPLVSFIEVGVRVKANRRWRIPSVLARWDEPFPAAREETEPEPVVDPVSTGYTVQRDYWENAIWIRPTRSNVFVRYDVSPPLASRYDLSKIYGLTTWHEAVVWSDADFAQELSLTDNADVAYDLTGLWQRDGFRFNPYYPAITNRDHPTYTRRDGYVGSDLRYYYATHEGSLFYLDPAASYTVKVIDIGEDGEPTGQGQTHYFPARYNAVNTADFAIVDCAPGPDYAGIKVRLLPEPNPYLNDCKAWIAYQTTPVERLSTYNGGQDDIDREMTLPGHRDTVLIGGEEKWFFGIVRAATAAVPQPRPIEIKIAWVDLDGTPGPFARFSWYPPDCHVTRVSNDEERDARIPACYQCTPVLKANKEGISFDLRPCFGASLDSRYKGPTYAETRIRIGARGADGKRGLELGWGGASLVITPGQKPRWSWDKEAYRRSIECAEEWDAVEGRVGTTI